MRSYWLHHSSLVYGSTEQHSLYTTYVVDVYVCSVLSVLHHHCTTKCSFLLFVWFLCEAQRPVLESGLCANSEYIEAQIKEYQSFPFQKVR